MKKKNTCLKLILVSVASLIASKLVFFGKHRNKITITQVAYRMLSDDSNFPDPKLLGAPTLISITFRHWSVTGCLITVRNWSNIPHLMLNSGFRSVSELLFIDDILLEQKKCLMAFQENRTVALQFMTTLYFRLKLAMFVLDLFMNIYDSNVSVDTLLECPQQ